jgi:hypothetical protein
VSKGIDRSNVKQRQAASERTSAPTEAVDTLPQDARSGSSRAITHPADAV